MLNKQFFLIKSIEKFLINEINKDVVLDPFGYLKILKGLIYNNPNIEIINYNLNEKYNSKDYCLDAYEFLRLFDDSSVDVVIYDFTYNYVEQNHIFHKKFDNIVLNNNTIISYRDKQKNEIARLLKPNGFAVCFGMNNTGIGTSRGFKLKQLLIIPDSIRNYDIVYTVEIKSNKLKY